MFAYLLFHLIGSKHRLIESLPDVICCSDGHCTIQLLQFSGSHKLIASQMVSILDVSEDTKVDVIFGYRTLGLPVVLEILGPTYFHFESESHLSFPGRVFLLVFLV